MSDETTEGFEAEDCPVEVGRMAFMGAISDGWEGTSRAAIGGLTRGNDDDNTDDGGGGNTEDNVFEEEGEEEAG